MAKSKDGSGGTSGPTEKQKKQNHYNEIASFFDSEIEKFSEWITTNVPADSWLRSELFARVRGPIAAWVESKSDSVTSPMLGAGIEKLSDLLEAIGGALRRDKKVRGTADAATVTSGKTSPDDWIPAFRKSALDRLAKAKLEDLDGEAEKIKKEFGLRVKLIQFPKDNTPAPPPEATESQKDDQKVNEGLIAELALLKKQLAPHAKNFVAHTNAVAERVAPAVGGVADWLEAHGGQPKAKKRGLWARIW